MPVLETPGRFLLRGSALLVGFLVVWWYVLLNPMLYLLRESAGAFAALVFGRSPAGFITETSSSHWTVEVPLEAILAASTAQPVPVHVTSIDFDLARSDAGAFTFGLPVYWAIILAVPGIRRSLGPLVLGTLLMAFLEIAMLLTFAEIFAHQTAAQWRPSPDPVANWSYQLGDYLLMSVLPYVVPFVVAISLHGELRWQILRWSSPAPARGTTNPSRHSGRRKGRSQIRD